MDFDEIRKIYSIIFILLLAFLIFSSKYFIGRVTITRQTKKMTKISKKYNGNEYIIEKVVLIYLDLLSSLLLS